MIFDAKQMEIMPNQSETSTPSTNGHICLAFDFFIEITQLCHRHRRRRRRHRRCRILYRTEYCGEKVKCVRLSSIDWRISRGHCHTTVISV